jgi:predicted nuclease of predicted toxin-antitoxin system
MKFKLDENLPLEVADLFRKEGYDIDTIQSEGLTGSSDPEILRQIQIADRILLTTDKGIADIRRFPPEQYLGIVLFRPSKTGRGEVLRFIQQVLPNLLATALSARLVIVSPSGIRSR